MSEMCRPWRRLFLCALLLRAVIGLAQTVSMTMVQDTVYRADGSPAQATLLISWPAFTTAGGEAIAAGTTSVSLGAGGTLSVSLAPNANATPANTVYTVVYQLDDGTVKTEYWIVPTASPATLAAVRTTLGASSSVSQMATQQFVNSALAAKANDSAVVHLSNNETIGGAKQFSLSPSVPTPSQSSDAANKAYVDNAVQNVGSGSYLSTSGGTLTGPLTLSGDPLTPNNASTKHYVDIWSAVKADLIGGLVPPTELASGTPGPNTCLLGNQTWGSCGAGGSSSYINSTLVANPNFNSSIPMPQSNFLNCSFQNTASNVTLQCPYGNTSSTFALGSQAVLNNRANTYGPGLQDFSAASLKLPSGPGYAPGAAGAVGFDTMANAPVINVNGVTQQLALTTSNISGQANTALALATTPAQCNGSFATGIQANGNANCSTADVIQLAEVAQPSGIPNYGIFWFDSTTHTPRVIDNNGQVVQLALMNVFNSDANTLEEYNGASPQTFNLYGSRTDAADYERLRLGYDAADNYFFVGADAAGTGTQPGLGFWMQGSLRWGLDPSFNFKPWSDNARDIGATGLRVRNVYLGTGLVFNSGTLSGVHGTTGVAAEAGTLGTTTGAGLCNDGNGNVTDQGCTLGAVSSVFGRSGVIVPQAGDYSVAQITGAAPLASPTFTGIPTAPTPSTSDSSTKLATTAWVNAQGYGTATGNVTGPASSASGDVATFSGINGKAIQDSGVAVSALAPLASPAFTGIPTAPTPSGGDSSSKIATTAYVQSAFNFPSTSGLPGEYLVTAGGTSPNMWSPWALDGMALPGATLDQQWNLCNTIMLILGGGTCNFAGVGAGVYPDGSTANTATIASEMYAGGLPAPGLNQSAGGSLSGTSFFMTSYVNAANGKNTVVSKESSITLTGGNGTVTVTSPTTFSGQITSALSTQYTVWQATTSGQEKSCGTFTLGTNATISANCAGAAKSGQGQGVTFLLPPAALWNVTITDGVSCGIEAFDGVTLDSKSSGITQGLFMVSSNSGTTNVNALVCTDLQSARGVGRVIRMRGVRVRNVNGATMTNAQSAAFVIGGNGGNLVDGSIFSGDGATASTGTALWVANVCCNDLFEFLQANGTSSPGGGQPLHVGDGASVTRGVTFLSTTAVNPGNGLNNIYIGAGVQGVSFAGATYMEGSKTSGCDTTNNFIEVNGSGDSVSFDTNSIGGGCNSASTANVSGNGATATATVSGFNWGPGYTSGIGITVSACGSFNGSYTIAGGGSGTTTLTFSSAVNGTQNSCTVSLTNGNTQYVYDITNASAFHVNQVPAGAGMQNLINDHVHSKSKTGSPNQVLGQYSFGNAGSDIFGGNLEVVGTFTADTSASFAGTVTAPTVATSDNSINVATTAFVKAQSYATLASPAFTGTPTAPTASVGDNSTKLATTAYVQGQTTGIPWLTVPRGGSASGVTFSTTANQAKLWGVVLTFPLTTTQVTYYVGTADNTANSYDIGIYDSSGNLKVHTGTKAGSTFSPNLGAFTLSWASSATLQPGKYYLAVTTNCTSSCAALDGDNASAVTFQNGGAVSVTSAGTLTGPITPPADAWSWSGYVPAWAVR